MLVQAAAARAGMAPGAWLGEAGVRSAEQTPRPATPGTAAVAHHPGQSMQTLMGLRAELMEDRRVLRNVGGNLNDIARAANIDGTISAVTARVAQLVVGAVQRLDETVAAVDAQVAGRRTHARRSTVTRR